MLREVRGPGTLVPREIRWIAAETNARVERIVVKPGAQVQADTVILELSNPEVIDQQLGAEAALKAAEADYQAHRMTLESQLLDRSEEHTSELQSLMRTSYAVFCLKKKTNKHN